MRAHRVRFTKPAIRADHPRATKTRDGITMYRRNREGTQLRQEVIGDQRRKQNSLCFKCGQWLDYEDAVFRDKEFQDGAENPVIHRKCPTAVAG